MVPKSPHRAGICLIACSATKATTAQAAGRLYTGDLFRKSLRWAQGCTTFRAVYVLSAHHGLVDLAQVIEPYDLALCNVSQTQRRIWAARVGEQLLELVDLDHDNVTALAGRHYTDELSLHLQRRAPGVVLHRPLAGLGIGEQKTWLKRELARLERAPAEGRA